MEQPRSETLRRKPLSECTNTLTSRLSTTAKTLIKPSKTLLSAFKKPPNTNTGAAIDNGDRRKGNGGVAVAVEKKGGDKGVSVNNGSDNGGRVLRPRGSPLLLPSTPARVAIPASTTDDLSEPMTVYTRRRAAEKRKGKKKMVDVPFSCPPVGRIISIRDQPRDDGRGGSSKSCKFPRKKKQRLLLPERDYIEQQRAYFAEIDAFELTEEVVVSESELE